MNNEYCNNKTAVIIIIIISRPEPDGLYCHILKKYNTIP